ncbi:MAG: hypothetical protein JSR87_09745 [Proteobacteria bacterium]|nr:hypothetical protein [Pseudomonadota bacterium]
MAERWPDRQPDWRGDLFEWERSLLWIWIEFFQQNALVTRRLAESADDIGPDFQVAVGDLTDEGLEMYGVVEERWYAALGRRDVEGQRRFVSEKNTKILESNLKRIKQHNYAIPRRVIGRK